MPQPGEIYFHSQFQFQDGHVGPKLMVVLNQNGLESLCLVLKTTSQSARYSSSRKGCNPDLKVFYVPLGWQEFDKPTYIQVFPIYPINIQELINGSIKGIIRPIFKLTDDCFKQLLNCLKKNFRHDINDYFYDLIYK